MTEKIMKIESHLNMLVKKHEFIDNEITQAMTHPSVSDMVLTDLKRKKLHLKEEIERLKYQKTQH
jgi:hypothetical protein